MSDELKHYGVLGMKWGRSKRRAQAKAAAPTLKDGTKAKREFQDYGKNTKKKKRKWDPEELELEINRLKIDKRLDKWNKSKKVNPKEFDKILEDVASHNEAVERFRNYEPVSKKTEFLDAMYTTAIFAGAAAFTAKVVADNV